MAKKVDIHLEQELEYQYDRIRDLIFRMMTDHGVPDFDITIKAVSDEDIADLNQRFKGVLGPTDVLTFTIEEDPLEGEIYISLNQASRSAEIDGTSADAEMYNLIIHGTLHLLGFHHDSGKQAEDNRKLMKKYGKLIF